jgi:biopolymer transport protein ExbD
MSMSTTGNGGDLTAEPNVTPMIDVLLVLLIIFMLIVPMSRKALDLQLPDPNPPQVTTPNTDQIVLEVGADGSYKINTAPVAHNDLSRKLHEIYDKRPEKVLFVKGDTLARYQTIIEAIDVARGAGWRPECKGLSESAAKAQGCSLVIGVTPKQK